MSSTADQSSAPPRRLTFKRTIVVAAMIAALAGAWFVRSLLGLSFAWSYLVGVNVVTLFLYGYDKCVAKVGWLRVPEAVLLTTTLAGGTPAAFIGQDLFRHKTSKGSYRRKFWLIVAVQSVVFGLWIYFSRSSAG
jgi:uncharacterized membrane protein YsdA (DUF1294 family)